MQMQKLPGKMRLGDDTTPTASPKLNTHAKTPVIA
jgi:hypothetical protein